MANQEQLKILKSGVENWNRWREENPDEIIDLYDLNIREINLRGANLRGADLQWANLIETDCRKADLR